jgi:hypothetical protein
MLDSSHCCRASSANSNIVGILRFSPWRVGVKHVAQSAARFVSMAVWSITRDLQTKDPFEASTAVRQVLQVPLMERTEETRKNHRKQTSERSADTEENQKER